MSQPRPLSLRLVRLAAGVAVTLSAVGLYGASGAWADQPASPGNSAAAHAAKADPAPAAAPAAVVAAAAAPAAAPAAAADHVAPGQAKKAAAEAAAAAPAVSAAVATAAVAAAAPAAAAAAPGNSDHSKGTAGTVGDPTKPQPLSNADKNPGGANNGGNCGDYCSTRDGSPSMNGNGGGKSTGKPCAGCVGKADNKNPPGQFKNGSDHNNGYECDGNHGIGKGNPAHTGCKPTPPPVDCLGHLKSLGHSTAECPQPPLDCLGHLKSLGHSDAECPKPPLDCLGHLKSLGHNDSECPKPPVDCLGHPASLGHSLAECGGTTTGGTTGTTTGGTTGGTTGATTGGTTGVSTGGTTGAATTGGTTGISTGGGTGAQSTGGNPCPTSTEGLVGPMPAGCHLGGDDGGGGALPFTGLDAMVLVGIGAVAAGLGIALTAAGSMRKQPQA